MDQSEALDASVAQTFATLLERFREATAPPDSSAAFRRLFGRFRRALPPVPKQPVMAEVDASALTGFLARCAEAFRVGEEAWAVAPPALNVWEAGNLGRHEVANCRVLKWFLDPAESHRQGTRFFRCLMHLISDQDLGRIPPPSAERVLSVRREEWADDESRVDILIAAHDFLLLIEAKIDASIDSKFEQLTRYKESLEKVRAGREFFGILLTRQKQKSELPPGFFSLTWSSIALAFDYFARDVEHQFSCRSPLVRELAGQYASFVRHNIV